MMISDLAMIEVISANRDSARSRDDVMVRIVPREGDTGGNMWVTQTEVEKHGYIVDPDQTCEEHDGQVTYGDVIAGAAPWITVGYHHSDRVEAEAQREWKYSPRTIEAAQAKAIVDRAVDEAREMYGTTIYGDMENMTILVARYAIIKRIESPDDKAFQDKTRKVMSDLRSVMAEDGKPASKRIAHIADSVDKWFNGPPVVPEVETPRFARKSKEISND